MADYEEQRLKRIMDNKRKMEELNLRPLAYEAVDIMKHKKKKIQEIVKPKQHTTTNDVYIPNEEKEAEHSREEDVTEMAQTILRPCSKQVMASGIRNSQRSTQRAQVHNASMASLVMTRSQICKNREISSQAMPQQNVDVGNENILPSQDAIGNTLKVKKGTNKTMLVENTQNPPENYSRVCEKEDDNGWRFGLVDEDEDFQSSGDDYVAEEQLNAARLALNTNESTQIADKQLDRDVNSWNLNDRRPIFLNEKRQPVGPDKGTLSKFSQFCGSLARDSVLAPLNFLDWRHVPDKNKLWEYVKKALGVVMNTRNTFQKKFIISDEGKEYVLSSIGALWRAHKSRIKKKHYFQYDNDEDRWDGRPESISDTQFKDLLNYWNLEEVKDDNSGANSQSIPLQVDNDCIEGRELRSEGDDL
ncbi:plant transposase, partial [Striga asiatica]